MCKENKIGVKPEIPLTKDEGQPITWIYPTVDLTGYLVVVEWFVPPRGWRSRRFLTRGAYHKPTAFSSVTFKFVSVFLQKTNGARRPPFAWAENARGDG